VVTIPDALWGALLDALADAPPGVERVAFLDGIGRIGEGVVTTITVPDAELHGGWYDVPAEAISEAGAHLRRLHMTRLAQVHTHGGDFCMHSTRDDDMAYTQRTGALSIVLPRHATERPLLANSTVHVRADVGWKSLDSREADNWVRIVPSTLNFRRMKWQTSLIDTRVTSTESSDRWPSRAFRSLVSGFRRITRI